MRPTRRCWSVLAAALAFPAGAVLFQRPTLLFGGAALGAWLLAQQYRFLVALRRADETLAIERTLDRDRVSTETPITVTTTGQIDPETELTVTVTDDTPVGTRTDASVVDRQFQLDSQTPADRTVFTVQAPLAGEFSFERPTVTFTDGGGLFRETWTRGPTATLIVEPRRPRNIHVGESGRQVAMAYGEHEVEGRGAGLTPAELRKYVAGDTASHIDWKATARLGEPHVREFEVETDRKTALVVDHRAPMNAGLPGETQLDYLREVGLVILDAARDANDPLGLYTVGDSGVTGVTAPGSSDRQYTEMERRLRSLTPTDGRETRRPNLRARSPAESRRAASLLQNTDSAFARSLTPYYRASNPYIERIADDPLFSTVQSFLTRQQGSLFTVICTDDSNRAEVREAVKLARRGENRVLVLLTPRSLFTPGGLGDLETAYTTYLDFEEFRRDLSRLDRVSALEVAPGDRLGAVLQSRRARKRRNIQ